MSIRKHNLGPLDLPLALFLISAVLGVWPAYDRSLCWGTLAALAAGCVLYCLVSRSVVPPHRWRAAATVFVLICALLALYFVAQVAHFGQPGKVDAIGRLVELIGRIIPPAVFWAPAANSVATFLEGILFLALALLLTEKRRAWRYAAGAGAGLIALALLLSESRGAWLAVAVTAVVWLALHWRPARVVAVAGALLALALVVYALVRRDVAALGDVPIAGDLFAALFVRPDRLSVYRHSLYLLQDYPLTGIGLGGQFAMQHSMYALLVRHPFLGYSHNLYLEVWLQQGLVGALAWLWLVVSLYQAVRAHAKAGADLLYQGAWLGLTATLLHGLVDARQYADPWCWFPFFGLLGLTAAIIRRRASSVPRGRRRVVPRAVVGAFLIAVVVSLRPLPATWHANLGCLLQARSDLEPALDDGQRSELRLGAADHFRRAIRVAPHDRTAQQRLGLIMLDETRFGQAVEHLEAAWEADPANTTTHKALGLAYVWVGDLDRAGPLLRNVPGIVEELNVWGWWWGTQGQAQQSLNAYRMALLLDSDQ